MKNFVLKFKVQNSFGYLPVLTKIFPRASFQKSHALTQILVESFTNAVKHSKKMGKENWITLELSAKKKRVTIRVTDSGRGISPKAFQKRVGAWSRRGRGLLLIQSLANQVKSLSHAGGHTLEAHVAI